ncbi:MAG: DUF4294 domain-containing protein [Bacteroidota bacterium]
MLSGISIHAQVVMPDGRIQTLSTIINGDTIPLINLAPIEIIETLSPEAALRMKAYLKLRRDVLKAYPYARLAANKLKLINDSLVHISNKRLQKKYIKQTEDALKEDFEKDLKNLTVTQGKILIKLIDRETGNTTYHLVKELRGSFTAFFWQGMARLFGDNLKSEYDPEGDDVMIEGIVRQIERGELTLQTLKKK